MEARSAIFSLFSLWNSAALSYVNAHSAVNFASAFVHFLSINTNQTLKKEIWIL